MITLRPTTPADLLFVLHAEQHPDNRAFVSQWSEAQHRAALADDDLRHLLVVNGTGQPVGYVILADVTSPNGSVECVRLVVTAKGQGYGRAALQAVQRLAFEEHHAHRLWLDVMEHNERARRLYESLGFVVEGTLRECLRVGEGFISLVVLSQLRREYEAQTAAD